MGNEFLVDEILPSHEIHLLAGPSGAGKTRWLLNILKRQWEAGKPFLGYESYPVPWAYVPADRTLESVSRTLNNLGIDPASIKIIPAFGRDRRTFPQIIDEAERRSLKLLVMEGFANFNPETPPNSRNVWGFLSAAQAMAEKADLTIIGVMESPKMKPNDKYENPRHRVSGVAAWGHYSETIMLVEPAHVKDIGDPARRLIVAPRNAPGISLEGQFEESGLLVFPGQLFGAVDEAGIHARAHAKVEEITHPVAENGT